MMFKIFWGGTSARAADEGRFLNIRRRRFVPFQHSWNQKLVLAALLSLAPLGATGCRTLSVRIPPANLKEPGWTVRQGQAVWHIPTGNREIAGEVLVATRSDGTDFVQFTKSPFPLVIAQATPSAWKIEFPPQNQHYSGHGAPPKRIIWLYLPRVLAGQPPPKNWTWKEDSSGWKLENHSNGEVVEGYFD